MKKFIFQSLALILLSITIGLVQNFFSGSPLPLFGTFRPGATEPDIAVFIQEIDGELLQELISNDMIFLVDARVMEEYKHGHIPGAYSLPVKAFNEKYSEFSGNAPDNTTIVTYCQNITCPDALLLAQKLYKMGHQDIFVYRQGFEEWQNQGKEIGSL